MSYQTAVPDPAQQVPLTPKEAKAAVKAAKAYAKATRPWFKKKRFILLGLIVIIVIISALANKGDKAPIPAADVTASATAAAVAATPAADVTAEAKAAPVAAIGTPVRDGKFEFTVSGMTCGLPEVGTAPVSKAAQGQFCLIDVTVKNIGDQAQSFFGANQYAFNAAAQKYTADSGAAIYLPEANSLFVAINPGNQLTGKVIFDVPADTTLTKIELHDSAFSGGVTVALS